MTRTKIAAVMVGLALAACGGATATPDRATVVQKTFKFLPASVHIAAGSKVTWVNRDTVDHTVTAGVPGTPTTVFDHPLGKKATVVVAFPKPGTFDYFCSIHNSMRGEIVVA